VASLIVDSAYSRHESRGLHFSRDYPETLPKALPTVLQPLTGRAAAAGRPREPPGERPDQPTMRSE
jgi:hypothetical protein